MTGIGQIVENGRNRERWTAPCLDWSTRIKPLGWWPDIHLAPATVAFPQTCAKATASIGLFLPNQFYDLTTLSGRIRPRNIRSPLAKIISQHFSSHFMGFDPLPRWRIARLDYGSSGSANRDIREEHTSQVAQPFQQQTQARNSTSLENCAMF